ncbi:MAG: cysteine hydrolase family protein [Anaerolineales bacterium]
MNQLIILDPGQTALLVIDVQRALFTRPTPVHEPYKLIEKINALVARAHLYGVQVIYTQHVNQSFLKKGTSGWDFHPNLSHLDSDLTIQKTQGNALLETALQSILEARNIKNLIITGLVTQGCIRATSLGGLEMDFRVVLVKGGHSNYNKDAPQIIEQREKELEESGVVVISPERIDFS